MFSFSNVFSFSKTERFCERCFFFTIHSSYLLCCPLLAPQITGILWPVPSPDIVNSSWQSKPVSSIVVAPASRLNDSKSSRKLHTPENYKKFHQYLTNVQCWNRCNHGQTIHPRQKFISMNMLQMSCVIT